jgi:acyl-CoA synthetase (AMP-forming)/AMP-acid ligase II
MITWLAVVANRAALVAINPAAQEFDAKHVLLDSQAVVVVTSDEHAELLEGLKATCPDLHEIIVLNGQEPDGLLLHAEGSEPLRLAESAKTCCTNCLFAAVVMMATSPVHRLIADHCAPKTILPIDEWYDVYSSHEFEIA